LNLFYAYLDHTRRVGGRWHFAKFGGNRCSSFSHMQVLIFFALGLKIPIQPIDALKMRVF